MARLLVANRGEIAVRIMRTAAEMGIATVAIHPEDDAGALHVREADEARLLPGAGTAAYLAIEAVVAAAREAGCDAVHPGYGLLSENPAFARACEEVGLRFVGPRPETIELFGDKTAALGHARSLGIPVLAGTGEPVSLEDARRFLASLGPGGAIMLKAVGGGGGRGMRPVADPAELSAAFERCAAEAGSAFGDDRLYAERLLPRARHVEVQVIGDGAGAVAHLWDRECSLQRRRQKLIEIAPALGIPHDLRERLFSSAVQLARSTGLRSLCTMEFLVSEDGAEFAFMEANPRLQVEHTVTEEILGLDLVRLQLRIAGGAQLAELGLEQTSIGVPKGAALQARVNLETMQADGAVLPAAGVIDCYAPPAGRGIRTDGYGYSGYATSLRYDSLLAKVIVSVPDADLAALAGKARRALADFRISGVATNIGFLRAVLGAADLAAGRSHTTLIDERIAELVAVAAEWSDPADSLPRGESSPAPECEAPEGAIAVGAPMPGVVVAIACQAGDAVREGDELAVVEAMKMQHAVRAPVDGVVAATAAPEGGMVAEGAPLLFLTPGATGATGGRAVEAEIDLDAIRPDLAEVRERQHGTRDEARPEAVARRRKTGQRTARENIADLCDPGSFVEYGSLTIAGRSRRASTEALIKDSPADGLVMGLATVNAAEFGDQAGVAVMSYDYTVFAGTQGARNHVKTDRLVELAERWRLPLVLFAEGGGGRPGDTDGGGFIRAFELFPKLSGKVPMVGVVSGRCFAGNAALLGCCDVIIATRNVTLGMGGPAMIEGGGLGVFKPEEVGPVSVHVANGVVDVLVDDEEAAVAAARAYLGYFQGPVAEWQCVDQRLLRHLIPENRLRVYDIRSVIDTVADTDSVLELRRGFGVAMITALARIEGRPVGVIANNPAHLGGAIDSDAADKAARFMALCDAHGIPIVSLSDTPGIMVGPEVEKTGLVRHAARMFLAGANATVPLLSVVLRKSYGLGAIAMTGGSYQASLLSVAWPTGEFGGMGFEGAVKLGYKKELEAIQDPVERRAKFDELVAMHYEHGKALVTASYFGIDDVIDPADTRMVLAAGLRAADVDRASKPPRQWLDSW